MSRAKKTSLDVPAAIKAMRKHLDVSQVEFAKMLGISRHALINYEEGGRSAPLEVLILILDAPNRPRQIIETDLTTISRAIEAAIQAQLTSEKLERIITLGKLAEKMRQQ